EDGVARRQVEAQALVDLVAADAPEIVALRIEEDALERDARRLQVRRLARPQQRVDRAQGVLFAARRILPQRVAEERALAAARRAPGEDLDPLDLRAPQPVEDVGRQLLRRLRDDLAGLGVHHILGEQRAQRVAPV